MPSETLQGIFRNNGFYTTPVAKEAPGHDNRTLDELANGSISGTRPEIVAESIGTKLYERTVAYSSDFDQLKADTDLSDTGRTKVIQDAATKALADIAALEAKLVSVSDERARLAERVNNIGFKAGEPSVADVMLELEVRRDLAAMDRSKRMEVARTSLAEGDAIVARAIFNAPKYKALFLPDVLAGLRREWTTRIDPATGARLEWFEQAEASLRQNFRTVRDAIAADLPPDARRRIAQSNA